LQFAQWRFASPVHFKSSGLEFAENVCTIVERYACNWFGQTANFSGSSNLRSKTQKSREKFFFFNAEATTCHRTWAELWSI